MNRQRTGILGHVNKYEIENKKSTFSCCFGFLPLVFVEKAACRVELRDLAMFDEAEDLEAASSTNFYQ